MYRYPDHSRDCIGEQHGFSRRAAEPATIATAEVGVAAPRCTIGQPCTFAAPIFICDYAGAEKIAAAGPKNGIATGTGFVREKSCQTVPAGRPLVTEATKSAQVIYLTEGGKHLGYMPVEVFALGGPGPRAACEQPGFCVVRPGPPTYLCPTSESLTLATAEAKSAAKCLRVSDSNAAEVVFVADTTLTVANMFGGRPPYEALYYTARADFVALNLEPYPTPAARGWCRPDTWCVTTTTTLFCGDRAAHMRVQAMPPGEPRRLAIQRETGCRVVIGGNVLKPKELPAASDVQKLISVEHPVLAAGWAAADAFPVVPFNPPLRYTARVADLTIHPDKGPLFAAIELTSQGTSLASGAFQAGIKERRAYCRDYVGDEQTVEFKGCMSAPDVTLVAWANCDERRLSFNGRSYGLFERPRDAAPDIHTNRNRRWLYRDLRSGEWINGSGASGEVLVQSAFNALCPAVDPEEPFGIVFRDPQAAYPSELWGRWFNNRRACDDPNRNGPDYEEHGVMVISAGERGGNRDFEYPHRVNSVRRVGPQAWMIDGSHRIDDLSVPEIFGTATYSLSRDGLALIREGTTSKWVRC